MLPARAPPHAQRKVKRKFKSQQFLSFFCIWKREQGAPDAHGYFGKATRLGGGFFSKDSIGRLIGTEKWLTM